jgi:CRP/FNR family cyclic AMP-dependent transcriptional regulator
VRLFTQDAKIEALKRAPLFRDLSKKELRELAGVTEDSAVKAGTVLCREGRLGREFFVIVEGIVEVTRGGKHLATRQAGEFFGEIALIATTKRTATVTATTPLRCLILASRDFRRVLDDNRSVDRKVMRALAERLLSLVEDPTL